MSEEASLNTAGMRKERKKCLNQQLLPGIPDHLTIEKISPMLSWPVLNTLTVVSQGWLQAIQSREICEARRFSNADQTAFVFRMNKSKAFRLALYSVEDNAVYHLPEISSCPTSTIHSFTHACLDGKLYVIMACWLELVTSTYVYDLAGHSGWRRCADLKHVNRFDDCVVMNGRIFIFSGTFVGHLDSSCAIYDPEEDVWTPITATRFVDEEVLAMMHGDHSSCRFSLADVFGLNEMEALRLACIFGDFPQQFFYTPPLENLSETIKSGRGIAVAFNQGRIFKRTQHGLHVYDSHTNTWTPLPDEILSGLEFCYEEGYYFELSITGLASVRGVLFALSLVDFLPKGEGSIHLWRCEPNGSSNHREVPVEGREGRLEWKQLMCSRDHVSRGLLKCPVQL